MSAGPQAEEIRSALMRSIRGKIVERWPLVSLVALPIVISEIIEGPSWYFVAFVGAVLITFSRRLLDSRRLTVFLGGLTVAMAIHLVNFEPTVSRWIVFGGYLSILVAVRGSRTVRASLNVV